MSQTIPLHLLRDDDLLSCILGRARELEGKKLMIDDLFSCPEKAVLWLRDKSNLPFQGGKLNPELRRLLGTWL